MSNRNNIWIVLDLEIACRCNASPWGAEAPSGARSEAPASRAGLGAILRHAARKKRKLVERDAVARIIAAHTNGDSGN